MSSKSLGPTANLIRNSRLMAMPQPLAHTLSDSQLFRAPYPTHQAITTPESSRARGDWGLKRSMPRKVESTYIKYNDIDTIEHMTKIESAHDTVMTLKKWQEMDIPLQLRDQRARSFTSAFYFENTPPPEGQPDSIQPIWGYRKKFVQHMTPGQLKNYAIKKLVPRRKEFEAFADLWFSPPAPATNPSEPSSSHLKTETGAELSPTTSPTTSTPAAAKTVTGISDPFVLPTFTVDSLSPALKTARFDSTKAYNAVREFLQIPLREVPMTIHPSAGMHYTLDTSYLENHPEYGPNRNKEVRARLIHKLDSRTIDTYRKRTFYVIGGIVQYAQHESSPSNEQTSYSISQLIRVTPLAAELDHQGRISIELNRFVPIQLYQELIGKSAEKFKFGENKDEFDSYKNASISPNTPLKDGRGKSVDQPGEMDQRLVSLLDFLKDNSKSGP
ncbi:hypothetical protein TWF106_002732 [Orbilia oligospora]|uniref:Uncharacterized protein n=1 Tax=Orbilia oligospora TaxID=2813651 RepID=A0A6G1LRZ7_ORBOL|nr:hypothetical protein TWF788_003168 [Orbilia oligospora]KAF3197909.1 hypothetical protein TWF679_002536 [Orbilia oligospora]KAF3201684.1 hypothetical protein TWF106_002732 [Orbilia oligospora]KAF3233005.1 hypothetical protein TWF192_002556 [Orbilia oligospora]